MLYRNEKSSRESDTCGSTGFTENKQRERRYRTEMDQAAGATDQLLLESKSHGTKNTRREREVTATNSKEKGHARPWQAALARTMKTTTGHGELFPAERTSRPPGPHGQALLGLDSHKSRSAPAAGREQGKELAAARGCATPSRPAAMRLRGTRAGAALPRSTPYGSADLETEHEE